MSSSGLLAGVTCLYFLTAATHADPPAPILRLDCSGETSLSGENHFMCSIKNTTEETEQIPRFQVKDISIHPSENTVPLSLENVSIIYPEGSRSGSQIVIPGMERIGFEIRFRSKETIRRGTTYVLDINLEGSSPPASSNRIVMK